MIRHNNLKHPSLINNYRPSVPLQTRQPYRQIMQSPSLRSPAQFSSPQQPKITFVHGSSPSQAFQSHSNVPFRELREKYTRSPSEWQPKAVDRESPALKAQQNPATVAQSPKKEQQSEEAQVKEEQKQEEVKYSKLRSEFENSETQKVYVDKRLNITEVRLNKSNASEDKEDKVTNTNTRIQCILEEKPVLEESRALFSEISYLKKKVNDYEDSNNRLRAEVYMLKSKIAQQEVSQKRQLHSHELELVSEVKELAAELKKRQQNETDLQREVKELQIELRRVKNEWKMATINQSEMSKKCQLLSRKNKDQESQIARLQKLLKQKEEERQSLPQSTVKSETITYFLN